MNSIKSAGVPKPITEAVHYYKHGNSACPISQEHGAPVEWPRGHVRSQLWRDVTCEECLKHKPEGDGSGR